LLCEASSPCGRGKPGLMQPGACGLFRVRAEPHRTDGVIARLATLAQGHRMFETMSPVWAGALGSLIAGLLTAWVACPS
jgi:hypothetical protein